MKRFGRFCMSMLHKGTVNCLDAVRNDEVLISCPVIALIILLLFFFWFTLPLLVVGLFFGVRYRFSGPDLDRDSVNDAMDSASDIVDEVKKSFTEKE